MKIIMRKARRGDIQAMNRIFNEGVKTEGGSLHIDCKTEDYWLEWFSAHDKKHPVFVGELEEQVVCWAAMSRYSWEYPYDGVAVLSTYLDPAVNFQSVQESLLRFVEGQARELGYYKLVVSVVANNRAALHAYRTTGFRDVGIYRNHGFYKGELVDMVFMERLLPVDMNRLRTYYREHYPFYEEYFAREEAMQELQMLRNGMMRSPENPDQWIPAPKDDEDVRGDDWGGATVRKVRNLPPLEDLVEQRLHQAAPLPPKDEK